MTDKKNYPAWFKQILKNWEKLDKEHKKQTQTK